MSEAPTLISQLYDKRKAKAIQKLYLEDPSSHKSIYQSISVKLFDNEKIILAKSLDMLALILKNNSFGAKDEEVFMIAIFLYKSLFYENPLPYLSESPSLEFAIKTLTALSFHYNKMKRRTEKFAAPSPEYYRATSQTIFRFNGYESIAEKHIQWESFLIETFPG